MKFDRFLYGFYIGMIIMGFIVKEYRLIFFPSFFLGIVIAWDYIDLKKRKSKQQSAKSEEGVVK